MLLHTPKAVLSGLCLASWAFCACTPNTPSEPTPAVPVKVADVPPAPPVATPPTATPTSTLPIEPGPDMKFDPPFDGTPVAVSVTANGIKVEDFVIGDGETAVAGGEVDVHYTGFLTDGSVFDSSRPRNRPFSFELGAGRVIKGWDEGVAGMKVGGQRKLIIPAALGYGERRAGKIPPNSTLVFTIDLLAVTPPVPPPQPLTAFDGRAVATKKLAGGLVVTDYKLGEGPEAKDGDTVSVHYRGTLKDGTEFDSSLARPRPLVFPLGSGRVIKGWELGIAGMKVGGLRKLVIPAALAYGERARGKIPANADLTFTVELMAVKPTPAPTDHTGHAGHGHAGTAQPGTAQPGAAQPGAAQPGAAQPGAATAKPDAAKPDTAKPDAAKPDVDTAKPDADTAKPGAAQPAVAEQPIR